jgi:two-component system, cell cycle sensor histidine kinase and response regulator CckA
MPGVLQDCVAHHRCRVGLSILELAAPSGPGVLSHCRNTSDHASRMPISQGSSSTSPVSKRPPGGYTILVVDDEEAVRRLACRMLTWTGYQALEASHGREAIATIEQHAGSVHLVLTDIKMPGMNGRELGRQVEQRWPGKPILYMSGFASEVFEGGLLETGAPFLSKPFTQDDLAHKVRTLLGS